MKKKVVLSVAVVVLLVMVTAMCVACTPNIDNVEKKFNNKDYKTVLKTEKSLSLAKMTNALIPTPESAIIIAWYDNTDDAKKAYDDAIKAGGTKETVKRKGNAVATGDKDAIKLF